MGASGWHYTTPYDADPEAALQRLREDTFAAGDYLPLGGIMRFPRDADLPRGTPLRFRFLMAAFRSIAAISVAIHWFARGGRMPGTIDELLAMSGENGTHSILDITHTADIPEFGAATPLTRHRLLKYFGTTTPTRAQVDAAYTGPEETPGEGVRRWEAVYFAVHDESGTPIEYVFVGASGD
jgi:hypothetical protein